MKELAVVVALLVGVGAAAAQDDSLKNARDLYASAAYDEALSELTRVGSRVPPTATREMDTYRAFCLVALGRIPEAETIAEALIRKDPSLTIEQYPDASPRVAAIFAGVRKRVLPQLIRGEYKTARALAADKSPEAESQLTHVRQLLDDAEKIGAWDDTLADLRIVVDGFLDLSHAAPARDAAAPAAAPADSRPDAPAVASPAAPVEFRAGNAGVVPPVILSQAPPQVPPTLLDLVKRLRRPETLDVVIDEQGRVDKVTVTQSVNSAYDSLVVAAARGWKYKPATKDGKPVRFVKTVVIDANAQ